MTVPSNPLALALALAGAVLLLALLVAAGCLLAAGLLMKRLGVLRPSLQHASA